MDPILTLDIIPHDSYGYAVDINDTNLVLRENQTKLSARGNADYIIPYRNEVLRNRGRTSIEDWEYRWFSKHENVWTPDAIPNIESWILPEYFMTETDNPTLCVMANNRIGFDEDATTVGAGGFEQQDAGNMPVLVRDSSTPALYRNYQALEFDGTDDDMDGASNTMWNVSTSDYMCFIAFLQGTVSEKQTVASKKNTTKFSLEVGDSSSNKDALFTQNANAITLVGGINSAFNILGFGRLGGRQFLRSYLINGDVTAGSDDTNNLNATSKPQLGNMGGIGPNLFSGKIFEVIFVNNSVDAAVNGVTNEMKLNCEGYLAWKYGVQGNLYAGHTYINDPPLSSS